MRCPQCGKDNPEEARYCSNCLTNLELLRKDSQMPEEGLIYRARAAVDTGTSGPSEEKSPPVPPAPYETSYRSVSEWREVAARQPAGRAPVRKRGIGGLKLDWAIYGGITFAIILAVVLMVTVWGNPMPEKVAREFMGALNRRDAESMRKWVYSIGDADLKISEMISRMGEEGSFSDLHFQVEETSDYEAIVSITGGTYNPGGTGFSVEITPESRLMLRMENHDGHWLIILSSSRVFP